MTAPTMPTADSIVIEALKKAKSNYTQADVNRAKEEWLEEVKQDIWEMSSRLKALHTTTILVTVQNQAKYPYPTDFSSDLSMTAMHGAVRDTAQGGSSNSVTLSASETVSDSGILGHNILIYDGTGKGSLSQCYSYNSTTKVASVNPDFSVAPDSTSKYMIVDEYHPLDELSLWEYSRYTNPTDRGTPHAFLPQGDSNDFEFTLYKVPYHSSGVPYGLKLVYYADLLEIDLDSTLMLTLYKRWRNVFLQGIYIRALQGIDDNLYRTEEAKYGNKLRFLISRETYGLNLSNLQVKFQ
ncbi:MAG: hypothetical protein ACE5GV_10090 [Candidatus Scalindua sp.]